MTLFHSNETSLLAIGDSGQLRIDDQISPHYTRSWDEGCSSLAEIARRLAFCDVDELS